MIEIAWVTSASTRQLISSERNLVASLQSDEIRIQPVVWDEPNDWSRFDAVIVRTTWDYHLKIDKFKQWLDHLDQLKIRVFNPADVIRWNLHKFYLRDLSRKGIPIIPTIFHPAGRKIDFDEISSDGWDRLIIKPAISATAHNLLKLNATNHRKFRPDIDNLVRDNDLLIQKFQPEVTTSGEWSLVFFNSEYSHAILKLPQNGDFRVQDNYGGSSQLKTPNCDTIAQATDIIRLLDKDLLYARVDGIVVNQQFLLMELELIEPDLFLMTDEIKDNFAQHIFRSLNIS